MGNEFASSAGVGLVAIRIGLPVITHGASGAKTAVRRQVLAASGRYGYHSNSR